MCNQWRETKTNELTLSEWKEVIRQLRGENIGLVGFLGGEPLMRKDIVEIIRCISAFKMSSAMFTSGFLLDHNKLEALIEAGLKHIVISIHGIGQEYEKIHQREWGPVEFAARRLAAAYADGRIDASVCFVTMKQTLGHLEGVRNFCKELGLPILNGLIDSTPYLFKTPENQRKGMNSNWISEEDEPAMRNLQKIFVDMKSRNRRSTFDSYADFNYISSYFSDPLQPAVPCTVSQIRIMINGQGEVYGGCWSMGSFGSIRLQSLRDILTSEKYKSAHQAMFFKRCPGCSCAYQTNIHYSVSMQAKNFIFSILPSLRKKIYADNHPHKATKKTDQF